MTAGSSEGTPAAALKAPPLGATPDRVWKAYEAAEPGAVQGKGGTALVDLIALVRHAIQPHEPLVPVGTAVDERYRQWLSEKEKSHVTFTPDQRQWLDAIRDHIAKSLSIEQDDFEDVPFSQMGGLGRAAEVFGDRLPVILGELNERLAA